jgi:acetylornithine/N-succinyldiaminopimelate aminotransferase
MLEPIQGEGGVVCPQPDYLRRVKEICEEKDLTLIFDEIQTGMGRTGKLFAHEYSGVTPHIMTLAKALGNGLPIGAMLSSEELSSAFGPGSHASTFGGTPLVTAVAKAVLNSILNDGLLENCREMGEYLQGKLRDLKEKFRFIKEVRGQGLLIGLELEREGAPVVNACIERGFLINCIQDNVLRFIPPLNIEKKEIDPLIETLDEIFGNM